MWGKWIILSLFVSSATAQPSFTLDEVKSQLGQKPYQIPSPSSANVFQKYCVGSEFTATVPTPNYQSPRVQKVARLLAQTKIRADERLKTLAQSEYAGNVHFLIEQLQLILKQPATPDVARAAQAMRDFLNRPGAAAFEKIDTEASREIAKALGVAADDVVPDLIEILIENLQDIDVSRLQTAAQNLYIALKQDLPSADLTVMLTAVQGLEARLLQTAQGLDVPRLTESFADLHALLSVLQTSDDLKYLREATASFLAALQSGDAAEISSQATTISDALYFLEQGFIPKSPTSQKIIQTLKAESPKLVGVKVLRALQEARATILKSIAQNSTPSWALEDLVADLNSVVNAHPQWLGTAELKWVGDYKREAAKLKTATILRNLESILASIAENTSAGDESAKKTAASAVLALQNLSVPVSSDTTQKIAAFRAEVSKSESQQIIATARALQRQLKKSKSVVTADIGYSMDSLKFYLQSTLRLPDAAKAVVAQFLKISENTTAWSAVDNMLKLKIKTVTSSQHFHFYRSIQTLYQLSEKIPPQAVAAGADRNAHWFLTQLCGEFRDRPSMIEAKLRWIENLVILPATPVRVIGSEETLAVVPHIWKYVTASGYQPYLLASAALWQARRDSQERYIQIGEFKKIDRPVRGTTVCETKYLLAHYVRLGIAFDSLEKFEKGYQDFQQRCPVEDRTDYYDFRGDANFKHYSPEANGMIWHGTTMGNACQSMTQAKGDKFSDLDCKNYFTRPFYYRYNAARAGLATWLFRNGKHAVPFASQGQMVAIYPHAEPHLAPFAFGFTQENTDGAMYEFDVAWLLTPGVWNSSDIGFNKITGLGTPEPLPELAYERLRDAVDRHTDWYGSGYNDGVGGVRDQAYSPFVASSYEMSASDGFTACGVTIKCPQDGLKRWMFVFRIKAQNWYSPLDILENRPIDFDRMWLDETSFGITGLANDEKAWDRLGTPMEDELDSILYLINVDGPIPAGNDADLITEGD